MKLTATVIQSLSLSWLMNSIKLLMFKNWFKQQSNYFRRYRYRMIVTPNQVLTEISAQIKKKAYGISLKILYNRMLFNKLDSSLNKTLGRYKPWLA